MLLVKDQRVIIIGFWGYALSNTTTQLCNVMQKAAIDNSEMNMCGCVSIRLYLGKQAVAWIWPSACRLLAPRLEHGRKKQGVAWKGRLAHSV